MNAVNKLFARKVEHGLQFHWRQLANHLNMSVELGKQSEDFHSLLNDRCKDPLKTSKGWKLTENVIIFSDRKDFQNW